jgi:hypothetical protein
MVPTEKTNPNSRCSNPGGQVSHPNEVIPGVLMTKADPDTTSPPIASDRNGQNKSL